MYAECDGIVSTSVSVRGAKIWEMQFRVLVPSNVKPGQTIRISCPDGTESTVRIPQGLKTGDSFIFELSVDQLKNPEKILESMQQDKNSGRQKGFLNRDIANLEDFIVALTVGLTIGMGIVMGFIAGVLYATKDVAISTQAATSSMGPMSDTMDKQ